MLALYPKMTKPLILNKQENIDYYRKKNIYNNHNLERKKNLQKKK